MGGSSKLEARRGAPELAGGSRVWAGGWAGVLKVVVQPPSRLQLHHGATTTTGGGITHPPQPTTRLRARVVTFCPLAHCCRLTACSIDTLRP